MLICIASHHLADVTLHYTLSFSSTTTTTEKSDKLLLIREREEQEQGEGEGDEGVAGEEGGQDGAEAEDEDEDEGGWWEEEELGRRRFGLWAFLFWFLLLFRSEYGYVEGVAALCTKLEVQSSNFEALGVRACVRACVQGGPRRVIGVREIVSTHVHVAVGSRRVCRS